MRQRLFTASVSLAQRILRCIGWFGVLLTAAVSAQAQTTATPVQGVLLVRDFFIPARPPTGIRPFAVPFSSVPNPLPPGTTTLPVTLNVPTHVRAYAYINTITCTLLDSGSLTQTTAPTRGNVTLTIESVTFAGSCPGPFMAANSTYTWTDATGVPGDEDFFSLHYSAASGAIGIDTNWLPTLGNQSGTVLPQIVGNANGGADEIASPVTSTITARFVLGSFFTLGLQRGDGTPLPSSVSLIAVSPAAPRTPDSLFPDNIIFRYSVAPPARTLFQAVHLGDATIVLKPSDPTYGALRVTVQVRVPDSLGGEDTQIDPLIYPVADQLGVPPQLIKAQAAQESGEIFDPLAYRYEPLSRAVGDYGVVSRGRDYRANEFEDYRFATIKDKRDPALQQGGFVDSEDLDIQHRFDACCGANATARTIVNRLNATQHWSKFNPRNFNRIQTDDFTAQTSLAASYGYLQMTYVTARDELDWSPITGYQNPSLLFDTAENIAVGGGSLLLGTTKVARRFASDYPTEARTPDNVFTGFFDFGLVFYFYEPWTKYNGRAAYAGEVAVRVPQYMPQSSSPIFQPLVGQ